MMYFNSIKWRHCFIFLLILFGFLYFFRQPERLPAEGAIDHLPPLEVGDWVLRMGRVADSRLIRHLSEQGQYSHIGMIVQTKPTTLVLHATTGDDEHVPEQVQTTTLRQFISPKMAEYYLIIRPDFINPQQKQQIANDLLAQQGAPFILAARHREYRYCTTILQHAIAQYGDFQPHWQRIDTPFFDGEYLFPDAFVGYPNTHVVYRSH